MGRMTIRCRGWHQKTPDDSVRTSVSIFRKAAIFEGIAAKWIAQKTRQPLDLARPQKKRYHTVAIQGKGSGEMANSATKKPVRIPDTVEGKCGIEPNFLGIGAPKCATTWLSICLSSHPEVFVPSVKEINYFSWRYGTMPRETYTQYFQEAGNRKAIGEFSVGYFQDSEVPKRIRNELGTPRLILALRDPVAQVYSHYWHLLRQNFHQSERPRPESFEQALDWYPEYLLTPASYGKHLRHWLDHHDRHRLHVVLYDDIKNDSGSALRKVFEFLEVDSGVCPPSLSTNDSATRKGTSPAGEVRELLYRGLYDFSVRRIYRPLATLMGQPVAEGLVNKLRIRQVMESLFRKPGYPPISKQTANQLRDYFKADIALVETIIGRDLASWRCGGAAG
jgi:hypothetical protein